MPSPFTNPSLGAAVTLRAHLAGDDKPLVTFGRLCLPQLLVALPEFSCGRRRSRPRAVRDEPWHGPKHLSHLQAVHELCYCRPHGDAVGTDSDHRVPYLVQNRLQFCRPRRYCFINVPCGSPQFHEAGSDSLFELPVAGQRQRRRLRANSAIAVGGDGSAVTILTVELGQQTGSQRVAAPRRCVAPQTKMKVMNQTHMRWTDSARDYGVRRDRRNEVI